MRLSLASLMTAQNARRPLRAVTDAGVGIVHLGLGAFHRAHQAVFTEDAMMEAGGDWGVFGVCMRRPAVADALAAQDGLFTVERLDPAPTYRIIGAVRATATLTRDPAAVIAALGAPRIKVITLTVTEAGYCLSGDGLDLAHPDVRGDLEAPEAPRSAIGVLARGLSLRRRTGAPPVTVITCDNLQDNGRRLQNAVTELADRIDPALPRWLERNAAFPETMVDCITPAPTAASRARARAATGLEDLGAVQREPFGEWVIQNRFAADRPAWERVGVEIVEDVEPSRRLKLHVLNAGHSALAYLGLERRLTFVREAMADQDLRGFVDRLMADEVAPGLPDLPVTAYWASTKARFDNQMIDHRLDQIALDGKVKLAERIYPVLQSNLRAGRRAQGLLTIVRAWLARDHGPAWPQALKGPASPLPPAFAADPAFLGAVLGAA